MVALRERPTLAVGRRAVFFAMATSAVSVYTETVSTYKSTRCMLRTKNNMLKYRREHSTQAH